MVQRRKRDGERDRISVSLDPVDYKWIKGLSGPSDSYKLSRIVRAARLGGIAIEDATTGGVLEDFRDWLKTKRKKTRLDTELIETITEYLERK